MISIIEAEPNHALQIADFQCKMALETEHLTLDKQLVEQASTFLFANKSLGQYFVPVDPSKPSEACGSLLITYENDRSWWIQSVYVKEQHRRKGCFTGLFRKVVERGREKEVSKVQLYVEKQNERAKKAYEKLGMYCNGLEFYAFQLVYGGSEIIQNLSKPLPINFAIRKEAQQNINGKVQNLKHFCGKKQVLNKRLYCYQNDQLIGLCEYFNEFSDWRFGLITYINYFEAAEGHECLSLWNFMRHLFQNCELKMGALRVMINSDEGKRLNQLAPELHRDVYDVMQIDL